MTVRIALCGAILVVLASQPARAQVTASQVWALFITTAEAAQAFSVTQSVPREPRPQPARPMHLAPKFEVLTSADDRARDLAILAT